MYIDSRDLRLLAAQGLTMREAARELGVPFVRVRRAAAYYVDVTFAAEPGTGRPTKITNPYVVRVRLMAAEGKTRAEIMSALGVCRKTLSNLERAAGVQIKHASRFSAGKPVDERAEKMANMYRQGLTLEKIGETFDITRERVRQIIKKNGLTGVDGGRTKAAHAKKCASQSQRDARSLARYGLSFEEMNKWRAAGLVAAYRSQENAARQRGIKWGLKFAQWIDLWLTSGKLEQRGRGKGKYLMSRIKDDGGYEVGNVHIQLATENSLEAVKQWRGKMKPNRGVFCLFPGTARPWVARVGRRQIGRYGTEADAVAARTAHIEVNGYRLKSNGTVILKKPSAQPIPPPSH